eukprot:TRINITY_DN19701_c0_g1_i8.p1 TRINITY_DN19701_c0_g1~~TRINITY_DN19701_c0_g1_i8.p1  ORF type:complete len:312 (-),score=86.05 TRINITY_DN19701_c0_g1_i8:34-969(-)
MARLEVLTINQQAVLRSPEADEEATSLETDGLTARFPGGASVDQVLEAAGGCGRFQYRVFLLLFLTYASGAVIMMEPVFLNKLAEESIGFSSLEAHSITSAFFAAFFAGLYLWGFLGDKYGRAPVLTACLLLLFFSGASAPVMHSLSGYAAMRGLSGLACAGVMNTTFVLGVEIVPSEWRANAKGVLALAWVSGTLLLVLVAWLFKDDQGMAGFSTCSIPALLSFVLCLRYLPESPRFLLSAGQQDRANEQLAGIAACNLGPHPWTQLPSLTPSKSCLLYTSDAADEEDSVDLGGRRIIKKKKKDDRIEIV